MTLDQIEILALLGLSLILFGWGRLRYDLVAFLTLLTAGVLGLVPSKDLFSGFGHTAVVTVALVLILSNALTKSGADALMAAAIRPLQKNAYTERISYVLAAATLSMFMNNIAALAFMMPLAIQSCTRRNESPSLLLMPLSFGAVLGGLVTLIGTPPNIIISDYRSVLVGDGYSMFDFTPVGIAVMGSGILFMMLIAGKVLKARQIRSPERGFFVSSYLFRVRFAGEGSELPRTIAGLEPMLDAYNLQVIALETPEHIYKTVPRYLHVSDEDILVIEGRQQDMDNLLSRHQFVVVGDDQGNLSLNDLRKGFFMEAVIPSRCLLDGAVVGAVGFRRHHNINLLAVSREGTLYQVNLRDIRLKAGDIILLHGEMDAINQAAGTLGYYPLAGQKLSFGGRRKIVPALLIFIAAMAAPALGIAKLPVSLGIGVAAMIFSGIISGREAYRAIDWPIVVLLGSMIPVGQALQTTGATAAIAGYMLTGMGDWEPWAVLMALLTVTMVLTNIINNAATAIMMAPVAAEMASALHAGYDPFLMTVAVGSSCAFMTPIGHQNNALVMGPGGYRFGDYWRLGLPLQILILLVAVPVILWIWPL